MLLRIQLGLFWQRTWLILSIWSCNQCFPPRREMKCWCSRTQGTHHSAHIVLKDSMYLLCRARALFLTTPLRRSSESSCRIQLIHLKSSVCLANFFTYLEFINDSLESLQSFLRRVPWTSLTWFFSQVEVLLAAYWTINWGVKET